MDRQPSLIHIFSHFWVCFSPYILQRYYKLKHKKENGMVSAINRELVEGPLLVHALVRVDCYPSHEYNHCSVTVSGSEIVAFPFPILAIILLTYSQKFFSNVCALSADIPPTAAPTPNVAILAIAPGIMMFLPHAPVLRIRS